MTRLILKPSTIPALQVWQVEVHNIVRLDKSYEAASIADIRELLQHASNKYRETSSNPPLGPLSFRYEHDERDRVIVVHALFTNKQGNPQRFARLRRVS